MFIIFIGARVRSLFNQILDRLEGEINPEEFHRWIAPLQYHHTVGNVLIIQVPNIFFKKWITDRYAVKMNRLLSGLSGREMEVSLITGASDQVGVETDAGNHGLRHPHFQDGPERPIMETGLNDKYSFDNFVVGSSNQLAHAAALAVANRSAAYNPLFLYGGSGLGKTHLLNAIGNCLVGQQGECSVVYLSSEDFTNELIEALRSERMSDFRQKYRSIDALLIDDIHFIGGKERTQEEFFYTFNALYEAEKQIVLSSDKMPKEIPDLEERLRSRFEGGLFADISPPDRETKVAILTSKAKEEGIDLTNEVGFFLASQNETNIRVLEGYLARLGAYASLTQKPVDMETATRLLGLFIEDDQKQITMDLIIKVASDFYNIRVVDLKSGKKHKAIATARQAVMYMARQMTALSTIEIGQRLGGRDHSTVIHAVKKIEGLMETDHNVVRTMSELQRTIRTSAARTDY